VIFYEKPALFYHKNVIYLDQFPATSAIKTQAENRATNAR